MSEDAFIRRDGEDYAQAFARLLPTGEAWSRDPDGCLMQLVRGQAEIWGGVVDPRAADLLQIETDPRLTYELLSDWERAYGLPDPCVPVVQTLTERRQALVQKISIQGGQSRAFFTGIAAALGYRITITEYVPFQFGLSAFGGTHGRIAPPWVRFFWTVRVNGGRTTRFQFGASSFGRDAILEVRKAEDLECIFGRLKPAHTIVLFDYQDAAPTARVERFNSGTSRFGNDPILRVVASGS